MSKSDDDDWMWLWFPMMIAIIFMAVILPGNKERRVEKRASAAAAEYHPAYITASVSYGLGRAATPAMVATWDIDVRFDGEGLPAGSGSVAAGEAVYDAQCAHCHGDFGQGEGRYPLLAGGEDTLTNQGGAHRPEKTVGSYWAYAPTLFDYIRRTMPYTAPQSLTDDETYAVVAYVLYLNNLVDDAFVADAASLRDFPMPNRDNFYPDPRPDVNSDRCMKDCVDDVELLESIKGVTPLEHLQDGADAAAAVGETAAVASEADSETALLYQQHCHICHASGVGGAPLLTATDDWQMRLTAAGGVDGLVQSVITGKGAMPPNGGAPALTPAQIQALVAHMLPPQ